MLIAIARNANPALPMMESHQLDDFSDANAWHTSASDQVASSLQTPTGDSPNGLCLNYDFNGVSGNAAMRRELPIEYPENYEFRFRLRGRGPPNAFEFKLIDASGDNVWWVSKANTTLPTRWTEVRYKKRHIAPAWGPLQDKTLRRTRYVEFTVSSNSGGKGQLCIDDLRFGPRQPAPSKWPSPRVQTTSGPAPDGIVDGIPVEQRALILHQVAKIFDDMRGFWDSSRNGDLDRDSHLSEATLAWRSDSSSTKEQSITVDFTRPREFGGAVLHWLPQEHASQYDVSVSDDAAHWRTLRRIIAGNGGEDYLLLAESEARYLRLTLHNGPGKRYGLLAIDIEDLAFGASTNAFVEAIAAHAPRGRFPRGFSGEQTYWTIVGVDGGHESGLIGEDGAIEVARGDFSVTPFVVNTDQIACGPQIPPSVVAEPDAISPVDSWSTATVTQSLLDGYLPMPSVHWTSAAWHLDIDAFAQGMPDASRMFARYTLTNDSATPRSTTLALAVQPFQVNPPVQFLTTPGGISPISELAFDDEAILVNGRPRIWPLQSPDQFFATPFDAGMVAEHLSCRGALGAASVHDETGLASGALFYRFDLSANQSRSVTLEIPLQAGTAPLTSVRKATSAWVEKQREIVAREWIEKLNHVRFALPVRVQRIADTLRTALAHMLINRDGVQIRPGTRSYARSWIRDGSMTSEALLRLGQDRAARDFLTWYAPYQFTNGKVPCCVDARGSDPVPENDSHGEFIFLAAEILRYTEDRKLAESMWSHVDKAIRYMDGLRASQRSDSSKTAGTFGLLPPSISHEGYSAKPAYSHWDNFWGLTGYESAAAMALTLGRTEDARRISAAGDAFRSDILNSLQASSNRFGIDFIPGAADIGDFDATSTTIALSPGGELSYLPEAMLHNTFERYWREFELRRNGLREWKDYTPYEWRNVAAFVRLGWKDRAHAAIDFFFADRRPAAWNQWAEVVGRDPRVSRFIGDMPHGWVASDFVRSTLDLFAYERSQDHAMILAAGIPADWLQGEGISIQGLETPYGRLSYSFAREPHRLRLTLEADANRFPSGGYVLMWPLTGLPGLTLINGQNGRWSGNELRIDAVPAVIDMEIGQVQ